MRAAILLLTVASAACATAPSVEGVRARDNLRATVIGRTFDGLVGCIGEAVTSRYQMTYTPSATGGAFTYSAGAAPAMILVDVVRADPPRAEVRVSGGPWLGADNHITRAVQGCAGR